MSKGDWIMCISKKELESKIAEIRELKMMKEEIENQIKAVENDVIGFLIENDECKTEDKKGNPIRQYIGTDFKATYASQSRETVDKEAVKKLLDAEQFKKVSKISAFNVLRIK